MSLAIIIPNKPINKLISLIQQAVNNIDIQVWPNIKRPSEVSLALVWNPPAGSLSGLDNLKGILSYGAGVDGILSYESLPNVDISRIVDDGLALKMSRYILTHILAHETRLMRYKQMQENSEWSPKGPLKMNKVGLLGVGQLGGFAANVLSAVGYEVKGWRRSKYSNSDLRCCYGKEGITQLASWADYIVCLLPLTPETEGVLNTSLFENMKSTAVLINVGRGGHLNEQDLIEALAANQLTHAVLDVFSAEPLPEQHPFWQNSKITVTPHISALTSIDAIVEQIVTNYQNTQTGRPLINGIDRQKGY